MMKMSKNEVKISVRLPRTLKNLMTEFVARDCHINESDLIRDSIREKISKDAPKLYQSLFNEKVQKEAPPNDSLTISRIKSRKSSPDDLKKLLHVLPRENSGKRHAEQLDSR
jgi:Arc/MetJ-type ribon-helix-helix transcriptional regulator